MAEPRWIPPVVIHAIHLDQIREHGGLAGLRDENALESALARPRQRWAYGKDVDVADLAAAYAFGISSSHPFRDGNKRVALLALLIFLGLNGRELRADDDDVVRTMTALAAGELEESDLAGWVRSRLVTASP